MTALASTAFRALIVAWLVHHGMWCGWAAAQDAAPTRAPREAAPPEAAADPAATPSSEPPWRGPRTPPPAQAVEPPLYYLKDKDGSLQPVPGFRFEDFEEMLKRKHHLEQPESAPRYSLQAVTAEGTVHGAVAEMKVHCRILIRDENWIRIPLRLDGAALQGAAGYKGPGEHFLDIEPHGGHVSWIRGGSGQEHQLTLEMFVPLVTLGDETAMKLAVPRAASSQVKLVVPIAGAVGEVSQGATLTAAPSGEAATAFTVLGAAGDFELRWRKPGARPAQFQPAMEALGSVLAKVDGNGIVFEAKLAVRSFGGPFEAFRVRLPKGAQPAAQATSEYGIQPVAQGAAGEDRKVVEVRLRQPGRGPVEVLLTSRLPYESARGGWCDLAGHEVIDAARQSGFVAVCAGEDWQVLFDPVRGVRQVDELPAALRREELVAGFEYFVQPFSLAAQVVPRTRRVSVEPEYLVLVGGSKVTLQARLKYNIRTAKVRTLYVEMPQWELDDAGPENVVAVDAVQVDVGGVLAIPLRQEAIGPLELTIRAHRKIPPGSKSLSLEVPQPRADSQAPAALVVLPDDDVDLLLGAETPGLVRQPTAGSAMKLPERQQEPLFYRVEPGRATFTAGFRVQPRTITVAVASQITLDEQRASVEQRLSYTIAHKPLERITLDIPRGLAAAEQLAIRLDETPLYMTQTADREDPADAGLPVRRDVLLPAPRIGACELVIRFSVALEKLLPKTSVPATIPLVMPADGELTGNRATVVLKEGVFVQPRDSRWTTAESLPGRSRHRGLQLSATSRTAELPLAIHLEDEDSLRSAVVDRTWIQTWITPSVRQDRAVFRFVTNRKYVELAVPPGVATEGVEVWLDGKRTTAQATPEGHLAILLPEPATATRRRLEVLYQCAPERSYFGRMTVELPRLARGARFQRVYWQLVLPRTEHLLAGPADGTPEALWGWNGIFWGQQPVQEQSQLEAWCGARRLTEVPLETNRYLFSALGPLSNCELWVASRAVVVVAASGLTLVVGLLVMYVRRLRHPASLLALATALAGAVFWAPGPALLAAQAASLGVAAVLAAALLQRGLSRPRRRPAAEPPSSVYERGTPRGVPLAASLPASSPTATMAAPVDAGPRVALLQGRNAGEGAPLQAAASSVPPLADPRP